MTVDICENCNYSEYCWTDGEMVCRYNGNYVEDNVKCPKDNNRKRGNDYGFNE